MTVDQFIAVLGALGTLLAAVTACFIQVRQVHALVNSRMTELLELTRHSAVADTKLAAPVSPSPPVLTIAPRPRRLL